MAKRWNHDQTAEALTLLLVLRPNMPQLRAEHVIQMMVAHSGIERVLRELRDKVGVKNAKRSKYGG